MNVVGLDLSLTSPGFATKDGTETLTMSLRGEARLVAIRDRVLALAAGADLAVIEGYAYGARGSAVTGLAELGGVVRVALYEGGHPFVVVPSTALKKYATGKGNVSKDAVVAAVAMRLGEAFDTVIGSTSKGMNDRVDAWVLRQMGLARFAPEEATLAMPKAHLATLDQVDWSTGLVPVRQAG